MLTNSSLPTPQSTTKGIPWSAAVSSGKLGEAGIIDGRGMEAVRERDPTCTNESVVFFNASHAIAGKKGVKGGAGEKQAGRRALFRKAQRTKGG